METTMGIQSERQEDEDGAVRVSARPKAPTAKMREYRRDLLERDFDAAKKACAKEVIRIQSALLGNANVSTLLQDRGKLETRIEDFASAHAALRDTLESEDDTCRQDIRYDAACRDNQEALRLLNEKVTALQLEEDRCSLLSKSHSRSSKRSKQSSASTQKATMAARAARLETELMFHDVETNKIESLRKQEHEIKKLHILKELAATQAEMDAVTKVEEESYGFIMEAENGEPPKDSCCKDRLEKYLQTQLDSATQEQARSPPHPSASAGTTSATTATTHTTVAHTSGYDPVKVHTLAKTPQEPRRTQSPPTLDPCVAPFEMRESPKRPDPDKKLDPSELDDVTPPASAGEELMQRLADLLAQRQDRDSLPRPEPEVFDGNPLRYPDWLKSFETLIERKTKDHSERLYYLGKYTRGEAKEAVSGLLSLDGADAYNKAKTILATRFGNPFIVADAFRKKIQDWPKISLNDGQDLRKFSDFLEHCNTAMKTIQYLNVLNDPDENQKILKKLPNYLVTRWSRVVDDWITEEDIEESNHSRAKKKQVGIGFPPFSEFCKFMRREARIACNPVTSHQALRTGDAESKPHPGRTVGGAGERRSLGARALATGSSEEKGNAADKDGRPNATKGATCAYCKEHHDLDLCKKFLAIALPERRKFAQAKALCWGCLKWGHLYKECRGKKTCRTCQRRHPTALHDDSERSHNDPPDRRDETNLRSQISHCIEARNTRSQCEPISHSLIVPVWLHYKENPDDKTMVYALLDDQSDACFVKQATLDKLGVNGPEVRLKLSTVLAQETITSHKITGLVVRGVKETTEISLPQVYTRDIIPARRSQIPRPESARKWPHLKKIADQLMPYDSELDVGMLIGINCARAIKPREIIPGNDDDPYAKRTALGWGVIGLVNPNALENEEGSVAVNRIVAHEVQFSPRKTCHFAFKTHTKEIVAPDQLNRMLELDFSERTTREPALSHEDRAFLSKVSEGIHQRKDGHYELPLPLKQRAIVLPNNKEIALRRLGKLKRRLVTDVKYRNDYLAFMSDVIDRGYAEKVPTAEVPLGDGRVWYIPHHGVYHPKKPGKIRIVFDCSVEFAGESLNRHLLQGPDLTNNLVGVLCRFRQEPVAFMCDVEAMFHQVHVDPEHRNFLRFLWWEGGNFDSKPAEYRMTVHLFGATSSPGCANFALKKTATDHEGQFGSDAANFVAKNFYVDDGLKSVPTSESAISLIKRTTALCQKGGFKLHKFVSNCKAVIDAIPEQARSKNLQNLDLTKDLLPVERALGVQWCIESDTLQFRVELKDQPLTRRGILSTVSSVFDPLGMISPVILLGKGILQELCRDGADWDDDVPDPLRGKWMKWREDLLALSKLRIPRCYKPDHFGEVKSAELHHFSDASKDGYGQCSYLRLANDSGQIHCALVMAKSRVAPMKPVTIPRLELTAALVSTRISSALKKELEYDNLSETFWTDSKVVIGYISNDARRFHTFVANRVEQIREVTTPQQWRYVRTEDNPADDASRGLYPRQLVENSRWWRGPDFLWNPLEEIPADTGPICLTPDDPEVKASVMATGTTEEFSLPERLKYFSSWHKAKRAVAVCLRLQRRYLKRPAGGNELKPKPTTNATGRRQKTSQYKPVDTQELQEAEAEIIRAIQRQDFGREISLIKNGHPDSEDRAFARTLKKASPLYKLDPFLDEKGLLRVGGRLKHAELAVTAKHPVIIPKKTHVTSLIISHCHDSVEHQGRGMTLNRVRASGFWVIGGTSAVSAHIATCVHCRRLRGAAEEQKMADLPEDRVQPAPPFSYCAVDYFGPWHVKDGRRQVKRYGVLFTCMASRAVHLEIAHSMTADSFLNAYRRFVGRRGPVRQLRSDQGTNFVGARNELQHALLEMDHTKIKQELLKRSCDWVDHKMNVPHASHMGGAWERQIRTVRNVLAALLSQHGQQLDDESLATFIVEAESIVNCRPLITDDLSSPDCLDPLTPNHLLTMKSSVVLPPPGSFQREDLYSRKRWRRVQHLVNEFWKRWKAGFLQSLQTRQKWLRPRRNLEAGDVVIVKDEHLHRNQWPLARVVQTYPSYDGLVRKVRIMVADTSLDGHGKRTTAPAFLDRPVQKLVLLVPNEGETGASPPRSQK